jgi:hypothetical protein
MNVRLTHLAGESRVMSWKNVMAINANILVRRRPSDRALFWAAAIGFPLLVVIGYAKTYYFSGFFDHKPLANSIVHAHAFIMSLWVVYFTAQIALIRTKNIRIHMTMGWVGVALAAIVIVVGMWAAVDSHFVRYTAPPGVSPHAFFMVPLVGMILFIIYFAGAIYYRKRPAEHKALMLMTAINFVAAAIARIPILPPQMAMIQYYGLTDVLALASFGWYTWKHKKFNWVFAGAVALLIVSQPLTVMIGFSKMWLELTAQFAAANGWPS